MRADTAIYIARGLTSGLLKIGQTGCVAGRVQSLAATVEPMELLASFVGSLARERELHREFASALEPSRGREWFHDDGRILAFVASLPEAQRGSRVFRPGTPRSKRAPEVIRAEREAKEARRSARLRAHGHVAGLACAKCAAERQRCSARSAQARAAWAARVAASPLLYPLHVDTAVAA